MFEEYKVVYCKNCMDGVFPYETAPYGMCMLKMTNKTSTVATTCKCFRWKGQKENGKDE